MDKKLGLIEMNCFEDFSPAQVHKIIYNPFDISCVIKINSPNNESVVQKKR